MPYIDKIKIGNVDYDVIGSGEKFPIGTELTIDKAAVIPDGWEEITEVEDISVNDFFSSINTSSGLTVEQFHAYRTGDIVNIQRLRISGSSLPTSETIVGVVNPDYAPCVATEYSWVRWRGSGNATIFIGRDSGDTDTVLTIQADSSGSNRSISFNASYIIPARTKKIRKVSPPIMASIDIYATAEKNAGAHNSLYRGKDISALFYNGTLSTQIAAGTFDNIFIGDYIIGRTSGTKYLVADINYRFNTSSSDRTNTNHILMIPEKIMGFEEMNDTNSVTNAYVGSKMYTTNLASYQTIITNDFGAGHLVSHKNCLADETISGYEIGTSWYENRIIDLMNERMVFGSNIQHNLLHGSYPTDDTTIDNSQLALFRYRHDLIVANADDSDTRHAWWLRDVGSSTQFCAVNYNGNNYVDSASAELGVRPAFLVY